MISEKIWTIKKLLDWTSNYLEDKGFSDPRLNAELLLCHALKYQERINLYLHFDKPLRQSELDTFKALLKRRLKHEPIQYILGEVEFMGLKFKVDKRVLIPRPETEVLVEAVIDFYNNYKKSPIRILDVGTGCANIAISVAKMCQNVEIVAIDASKPALEVAKENLQNHNLSSKIKLMFLNIFDDVSSLKNFDVVVSNPPYISKKELPNLSEEIRNYEPLIALTDGNDGLSYFRRIAEVSRSILDKMGWLFFEVAYDQSKMITGILENYGYFNIEVLKDLSGNERVIKARWSK